MRTVVEVGAVGPGQDQHLVGGAAPERADDQYLLVGVDDPVVDVLLGVDRGAEQAAPGEAGEAGLLLDQLTGDEGHPEQLAVRVLDGGARLPAGIDDGLAVAEAGDRRVLLDPIPYGGHHRRGLLVAEHRPRVLMVRGQYEDLVDPARTGLGEDRSAVGDHEGRVALEGRVEIGDDPDQPLAVGPAGLQGRSGDLLVAGAERAGPRGVGLDRRDPGAKAWGRVARSVLTTTQRPVSGSSRSWFIDVEGRSSVDRLLVCAHDPRHLDSTLLVSVCGAQLAARRPLCPRAAREWQSRNTNVAISGPRARVTGCGLPGRRGARIPRMTIPIPMPATTTHWPATPGTTSCCWPTC